MKAGYTVTPSAQPEQDGDTERRILAAAHTVFSRRGTAGARMQDIAEEAGVNHALLHYYFRSKQQLAETVFMQAAATFFPPLMQLLGSDVPLETKVRQVVEHEISTLRRTPFLPGYIISEIAQYPDRVEALISRLGGEGPESPRARGLRRLQADIDGAVARGDLRPITLEQFMVNLVALCVFPFAARPMLQAILDMTEAQYAEFIEHRRASLADFFLAGLRP